jgi:DnaJ-class molecular chaperone
MELVLLVIIVAVTALVIVAVRAIRRRSAANRSTACLMCHGTGRRGEPLAACPNCGGRGSF